MAEEVKRKKSGFVARVLAVLGIIQGYNIIAHAQNVVTLSQSIHWLTGWWHFVAWYPFRWLHLDLPVILKDVLVLFVVAGASGGLMYYRRTGRNFLSDALRSIISNDGDRIPSEYWEEKRRHVVLITTLMLLYSVGLVLALGWYIVKDFGWMAKAGFAVYILFTCIVLAIALRDQSAISASVEKYVLLLLSPFAFAISWSIVVSGHPKALLWSAGAILLLLSLSYVFAILVDPYLIPWLNHLPQPPAA